MVFTNVNSIPRQESMSFVLVHQKGAITTSVRIPNTTRKGDRTERGDGAGWERNSTPYSVRYVPTFLDNTDSYRHLVLLLVYAAAVTTPKNRG